MTGVMIKGSNEIKITGPRTDRMALFTVRAIRSPTPITSGSVSRQVKSGPQQRHQGYDDDKGKGECADERECYQGGKRGEKRKVEGEEENRRKDLYVWGSFARRRVKTPRSSIAQRSSLPFRRRKDRKLISSG